MARVAVQAKIYAPDSASLFNATTERCFRCVTYANGDSGRYEAEVFVEQEDGEIIAIRHDGLGGVNTVDADEAGHIRVVAHAGRYFVAVWATASSTSLSRSTFDTLNPQNGWTSQGTSLTINSSKLWDMHALAEDGTGDYVLAYHKQSTGQVEVIRYNGLSWASTVWVSAATETPVNCLGVWGFATTYNTILVSYALSAAKGTLKTARFVASTGSGMTIATTLAVGSGHWTRAAHCRSVNTGRAVLLAEWISPVGAFGTTYALPTTYGFRITLSTAAVFGNYSKTTHASLQSRPWRWGGSGNGECFAVVGFMSHNDPGEWDQNNCFGCHLDEERWGTGAGLSTWRFRPQSNLNLGNVDARSGSNTTADATQARGNCGNHLPHPSIGPPWGPFRRSYVVPLIVWGRKAPYVDVGSGGDLRVSDLGVADSRWRAYRFIHSDAHVLGQDGSVDPEPSNDNVFLQPLPWTVFPTTRAQTVLFISGGTPQLYDGVRVYESGYCWHPEIVQLGDGGAAGPHPANAIYYYSVFWENRDSHGRVERSQPSRPVKVTVDAGGAATISVVVRTLSLTARQHAMWDKTAGGLATDQGIVYPVVCRTTNQNPGGVATNTIPSIFFRIDSILGGGTPPAINDPTVETVTVFDAVDDSTLTAQEMGPYQLVGDTWTPLPNFQPPSSLCCTTWRNRIWIQPMEQPSKLWYSGELVAEQGGTQMEAPRWNPSRVYDLGSEGAYPATALEAMDDALVVFRPDRIHILTGEGAADDGSGATLRHQRVAVGIGAMHSAGIAPYEGGIFFQGQQGYYHLSRSYVVEYIGAPVEDLFRLMGLCVSAVVLQDRHQLRVTGWLENDPDDKYGADGVVAVYDYLLKQWSVFRPPVQDEYVGGFSFVGYHHSVTSRDIGRLHGIATRDRGFVMLERATGDPDLHRDLDETGALSDILAEVKTAPIALGEGGLLGFKRLWRFALKFDWDGGSPPTAITVEYLPNASGNFDDETTPYVVSFAGVNLQRTLGVKPNVQKIQSAQIAVRVEANDVFKLQAIVLEWGQKRGIGRMSDGRWMT